jgi:glycosyltransferase involved in cell wall biosynthesis
MLIHMRVLVGTYRGRTHVSDCLRSLERHVRGVDDLIFIDDSGDAEIGQWLATYGSVRVVGRRGYNAAMKAACEAASGVEAFWLEEDFVFTAPVDLGYLSELLYHRPYLAQVALLRGPHFPVEHEHGGLIEALQVKGHEFRRVGPLLEHTATFTCNPSAWRAEVWNQGWPDGKWSEDRKQKALLNQGYRFAFLGDQKMVEHSGIRSGFGY